MERTVIARSSVTRDRTFAELALAYGLITGAALGAVMMALTGSVWWVIFTPSAGLLVGLLAGAWRRHRSMTG